jgi:hypothetical protein
MANNRFRQCVTLVAVMMCLPLTQMQAGMTM